MHTCTQKIFFKYTNTYIKKRAIYNQLFHTGKCNLLRDVKRMTFILGCLKILCCFSLPEYNYDSNILHNYEDN